MSLTCTFVGSNQACASKAALFSFVPTDPYLVIRVGDIMCTRVSISLRAWTLRGVNQPALSRLQEASNIQRFIELGLVHELVKE